MHMIFWREARDALRSRTSVCSDTESLPDPVLRESQIDIWGCSDIQNTEPETGDWLAWAELLNHHYSCFNYFVRPEFLYICISS